jgi:hypothetical protein
MRRSSITRAPSSRLEERYEYTNLLFVRPGKAYSLAPGHAVVYARRDDAIVIQQSNSSFQAPLVGGANISEGRAGLC